MMMEKEYIQQLLDSYMAAETTREEEQLLSDYFRTHQDIPAQWRNYSILFRGISRQEQKPKARRTWLYTTVGAIAASIVLLLSLGHIYNKVEPTAQQPMTAMQETMQESTPEVGEKMPLAETTKEEKPVLAEAKVKTKTNVAKGSTVAPQEHQAETAPTTSNNGTSSATEDLEYYIARLEAEMASLDDSVSKAHIEKLIAADVRLQQLVYSIVGKQAEMAINEIMNDSTANYINF